MTKKKKIRVPLASVPSPDRLRDAFGLTPAEAEIVSALAQGHSVRKIAKKTDRAEATVRWHIKQAKGKFGVSRQTDLLRFVFSLDDSAVPRLEGS